MCVASRWRVSSRHLTQTQKPTRVRRAVHKDQTFDSDMESEDSDGDRPRGTDGKRPLTTRQAVLATRWRASLGCCELVGASVLTPTGDTLSVPLGTTAFVFGKTMFDILPRELQSVAVRSRVRYAPYPYVWMSPAAAYSTGLAIESKGRELPSGELLPWTEDKVKVYPVVCAPFTLSLTLPVVARTDSERREHGRTR
jgi:hypothetical protein